MGKKCLIASAGFHLLLLGILVVGPAFLTPPQVDVPVVEFVPMILTDKPFQGGGNPNAAPPVPPPQPEQPRMEQPAPKPPPPVVKQTPKPEPISTPKADADAVEVRKPHKIVPNTTLVRRPNPNTSQTRERTEPARNETTAFAKAAENIRKQTSPSMEIEPFGPRGGGPTYASYAAWVKTVYTDAWIAPEDINDDEATTKVSITIRKDGTVVDARIIQSSGNAAVDRSVQSTLDRVKTIGRPFPEGAKESERSYKINFNLKAKQLL